MMNKYEKESGKRFPEEKGGRDRFREGNKKLRVSYIYNYA